LEEEMASVLDMRAESYRFNSTLGQHSSLRQKHAFVGAYFVVRFSLSVSRSYRTTKKLEWIWKETVMM
jgi:hypothetical protein